VANAPHSSFSADLMVRESGVIEATMANFVVMSAAGSFTGEARVQLIATVAAEGGSPVAELNKGNFRVFEMHAEAPEIEIAEVREVGAEPSSPFLPGTYSIRFDFHGPWSGQYVFLLRVTRLRDMKTPVPAHLASGEGQSVAALIRLSTQ
jgi:hypothetical protein